MKWTINGVRQKVTGRTHPPQPSQPSQPKYMKHLYFLCVFLVQTFLLLGQRPQLIPPMSHAAYVRALACSPDGKYVLTCAGYLDNTVLLWNAEGRLLKIMDGHHNDLVDAEFSADGNYMLTLETNTWAMHLWDKQGRELRVLSEGTADVTSCLQDACFAPDNKHILAGDCGGNLHLYDLTGKLIRDFQSDGEAPIAEVAFSKSGRHLASCDDAGIIRVYQSDGTHADGAFRVTTLTSALCLLGR